MPPNIIQEFIKALNEEIEAIKKGGGGSIVKIFNGRFLREIAGTYVYLFNLENFLVILDESPAEIEIRGSRYPAHVFLTRGLEVEVGLEHNFGQYIADAKLQTNLWYLLELLKKKYEECQIGSLKPNFSLSEVIFTGNVAIDYSSKNQINFSPSAKPPNHSQQEAIKSSFFSPLSIIWGPPGTGKTKTIANAIEAHLNAGRRVLLVSHANNAVDEALEDVASHLKRTSFYQDGKLIRLGKPQEKHLKILEKDYPLVLLDKIAEKLGETLTIEKGSLENEKARSDEFLEKYEAAFQAINIYRTLFSELKSLQSALLGFAKTLEDINIELRQLEENQIRNREKLIQAQSAGTLKRLFKGLDTHKIQRAIDLNSLTIDKRKRQAKEIETQKYETEKSIENKKAEADKAKSKADLILGHIGITVNELQDKKKEADRRKDLINSRIAEINSHLAEIQKNALSEAKLVATTLTKTFSAKQFPDNPFDVLVLDEASMAPLPLLYWAAGRCRQFATIVGDFCQLPPICISEKTMARKWLGRSIFGVLGITRVAEACQDQRVKLLKTQYRMAPEISAIPNRFFYQGNLEDHSSTYERKIDDGIAYSPLVLIETGAMNPWCSKLSTGGRFNLYNALVSATLARRIIGQKKVTKVAIITPYIAQARLINKIVKDWNISESVHVSNVHKFQGGEESIIIFDSCEGTGLKVAPMLAETMPDSDARKLLNVAFSRAQNRFYFIGHTKHLLSDVHKDAVLRGIIHHLYEKAEIIDSETLVDNYFTADFEKWAEEILATPKYMKQPISGTPFTERNFWAQFFQDLKEVKNRLIILSPFLAVRRSSILMDYFQSMKSRGIDIRIFTRPRNQQTGRMAEQADIVIEQLRRIGCKVVERQSMHQKVAIMDNTVLWEGSLNILSHQESGEQMRRFEGNATVEEIIRDLELEEEKAAGTQTEEKCPGSNRFPHCDGYLVVRTKYNRKFLGCSNYPRCDYTRPIDRSTGRRRR
jgi:superfamily I DNA and/or RNA helicase